MQKVGAEAFAFVNFARFAVPLRIGLALSTAGWIDENVVKKFIKKEGVEGETEAVGEEVSSSENVVVGSSSSSAANLSSTGSYLDTLSAQD